MKKTILIVSLICLCLANHDDWSIPECPCPDGKYWQKSSKSCQTLSDTNCLWANEDGSKCLECKEQYFVNDSDRCSQLPTTVDENCVWYGGPDQSGAHCKLCDFEYFVSGTTSVCTKTKPSGASDANCEVFMQEGTTIKCFFCKEGYYIDSNGTCINTAIPNCEQLGDEGCLYCKLNYIHFGKTNCISLTQVDKCYYYKATSASATSCISCEYGYYLNASGQCAEMNYKTNYLPYCESYKEISGSIKCDYCENYGAPVFLKADNTCDYCQNIPNEYIPAFPDYTETCSCEAGEYFGYDGCTKFDIPGCETQADEFKCSQCKNEFTMYHGFCIEKPSQEITNCVLYEINPNTDATICIECTEGFYPQSGGTSCVSGVPTGFDVNCNQFYMIPDSNDFDSFIYVCIKCKTNYYTNDGFNCVDKTANPISNCQTYGNHGCTACNSGYLLYESFESTSCVVISGNEITNCAKYYAITPYQLACGKCNSNYILEQNTCANQVTTEQQISNCGSYYMFDPYDIYYDQYADYDDEFEDEDFFLEELTPEGGGNPHNVTDHEQERPEDNLERPKPPKDGHPPEDDDEDIDLEEEVFDYFMDLKPIVLCLKCQDGFVQDWEGKCISCTELKQQIEEDKLDDQDHDDDDDDDRDKETNEGGKDKNGQNGDNGEETGEYYGYCECGDGFEFTLKGQCKKLIDNCKDGKDKYCYQCNTSYYISNDGKSCIKNPENPIANCKEHFQDDAKIVKCLVCEADFYPNQGGSDCTGEKPAANDFCENWGYLEDQVICFRCLDKYNFNDNDVCILNDDQNCAKFERYFGCEMCKEGYGNHIREHKLEMIFSDGCVKISEKVENCIEYLAVDKSKTKCIDCGEKHLLKDGKCELLKSDKLVAECVSYIEFDGDSECVECKSSFSLYSDGGKNITCKDCPKPLGSTSESKGNLQYFAIGLFALILFIIV